MPASRAVTAMRVAGFVPFARRQGFIALVAVVCLIGHVATLAHAALVRHVTCVEHGEFVHLGSSVVSDATARRPSLDITARVTPVLSAFDEGHTDCPLSGFRSVRVPDSSPPLLAWAPASAPILIPALPPVGTHRLYRVAPKNSPPHVLAV